MIGNKISFCRKKVGMSQEELADRLDISRQAVSRWETGQAVPDTEKIIQLSRLFHVSTDYLLLDEVDEPQEEQLEKPQTDGVKEKRRQLRLFCGKTLLGIGILVLAGALIGAGFEASQITWWYTEWGKYGTVLFCTWMILPFLVGIILLVGGIVVLWREYLRED